MRILITGATGYVGRRVAEQLVAAGHTVTGLVRDERRRASLPAGVEPLIGQLERFATLRDAAQRADAIVHTAFPHHEPAWAEAVAIEAAFVRELIALLDGSGKAVIVSNGSVFLGDSGARRLDETAAVAPGHPGAIRAAATSAVTATPGIRGIEIRLASFVYGHGGSFFLPILLAHARRTGQSLYVGDGSVRTSALHVDAAAEVYVRALERPEARGVYHVASEEEPTIESIAAAVALAAGAPCVATSVSLERAAEAIDPFTAMFLATNNRLDASKARRELGFHHAGYVPLLWDVARGSYAR